MMSHKNCFRPWFLTTDDERLSAGRERMEEYLFRRGREGGREGSMKLESVRFSCLWVEFVCCLFYISNPVQPGKRGGLEICTILLISQHYLTNISFSFLSYFFNFLFQNILNYFF
jgi:hypothetical protein